MNDDGLVPLTGPSSQKPRQPPRLLCFRSSSYNRGVEISAEHKETYLALLRSGKMPPEAAQLVHKDFTASMFRRLTNESSANYDPQFAADYLRARAEQRAHSPARTPSAKPRTTTLSGHVKANYIPEETLDEFLEHVSNGVPLYEACAKLEPKTSLTQINRRAVRDPEFAERYAEAKEEGYPQFQEGLRAQIIKLAHAGDYRAARDLAIIHLPEFKQLTTQRHELTGEAGAAIRLVAAQALPELPQEMLDSLIEHVERKQIAQGEAA